MIIYAIFSLIVAVTLAWTLIKQKVVRAVLGLATTVALIGATTILTLNFTTHYGMHQVTTVTTQRIYSATGKRSAAGVVIAKPLGTQSDNYVLVYSDHAAGKATPHFVPNRQSVTTMVKKRATYQASAATQATVQTTTVRWQWRNATAKRWLNVGDQAGELVRQKRLVKVPRKTWVVLSPDQMKTLKKALQTEAKATTTASAAQQAAIQSMSQEQRAKLAVKQIKQVLK
ncbi:DUF4811 domain-containing protein [Levilactobacillus acidifarinae]|uniref:DUF4811 domain-containing protein n=1 Tax=Levilactobacillus acidifarinae DSM 19394 = JCM 15949 TaxID=1423715 RepID=A0A0R1LF37_9LACO|nr:DUF4811 domain-containing protein [Levilactobacillus acidifarinae]KRK94443.1 hypothetical protein FD25_GL000405 [Levilactobacillus acidifarinae DSM 19394]GEO68186.1 DUF4811 domain-containing protein [Levilactobacillus acidifarinae]